MPAGQCVVSADCEERTNLALVVRRCSGRVVLVNIHLIHEHFVVGRRAG